MGVPLNLQDIQSGFLTASTFNENNTLTEQALAKTLNRTSNASDNAMEVNFDMGLNKIFNLEDGFLGHEATNLSQVQRLIQNASSGLIARLRETRKTATDGQTVFNLADITYTPGANSIMVYVNGVAQVAGIDYQETDSTTITFFSGLNAGDAVDVYVNESTTNISDTVLREQLGSEAFGEGASLVSMEGGPTVEEAVNSRVIRATSITDVEAAPATENYQIVLVAEGKSSNWEFLSSDLSTEVAADPDQDYYIAPSSDVTGASGAWIRNPQAVGTDGNVDEAIKYDYPESKNTLADSLSTSGIFWKAEELYDPNQQIQVVTNNKRLTLGSFNDEAATSNIRFGEGSGTNKYENIALVNCYLDGSGVVDGSDNFANATSVADLTQYHHTVSDNGTVGFSLQKNYDLPAGTGTVSTGSITGSIARNNQTIGFEHFGCSHVSSAGNTAIGDSSNTFIGFRYTGDSEDYCFSNSLAGACAADTMNGLSVQADVHSTSVSGIAISDVTNGVSMPDVSGPSIDANSRFGRYTGTINGATSGLFLYGPNYNVFDFNVANCTLNALREETLVAGDLKSNRYDLAVFQCENVGTLDSSNNIVRVLASDIQRSGLIISGSHNHVTLVIDGANIDNASLQSFQVNGDYNVVDVISTGNPTAFADISIGGNKNQLRAVTDSQISITGNNNIVSGFAASVSDSGTGNNTSGVNTY
jgi:hypothetical protein